MASIPRASADIQYATPGANRFITKQLIHRLKCQARGRMIPGAKRRPDRQAQFNTCGTPVGQPRSRVRDQGNSRGDLAAVMVGNL